jgi:SAM-dependent methyltransferase
MFRHPILSPTAYLNLYAEGAADEWSADDARQDLPIIRNIITQRERPAGVLDVGCGAGDFLLTLPPQMMKYGVEPSVAAAKTARERGILILAPTLEKVPVRMCFDVITIVDVIEHVAHPGHLLNLALPHLAPGGCLIVATGDASNWFWNRIFRSRFWYSSFPEHITFPSPQYFSIWHQGKDLHAPTAVKLKYRLMPWWKAAVYFVSQVMYFANPWLLNCVGRGVERLRDSPGPRRRFFSPGAPGLFKDHQIVAIERQS